jgi:hypothetical protein
MLGNAVMTNLNGDFAEIKDIRAANIKYLQINCLENRREKEPKKLKRKGGGGKETAGQIHAVVFRVL